MTLSYVSFVKAQLHELKKKLPFAVPPSLHTARVKYLVTLLEKDYDVIFSPCSGSSVLFPSGLWVVLCYHSIKFRAVGPAL